MPTVTLTLARVTPDDRDDWLEAAASLLSDPERSARCDTRPGSAGAACDRRALLRLIAAGAGGGQPADVEITTSGEGKPELAELRAGGQPGAQRSCVVVAACEGAPVGVDIEPGVQPARLTPAGGPPLLSAEAAALRELPDAAVSDWWARTSSPGTARSRSPGSRSADRHRGRRSAGSAGPGSPRHRSAKRRSSS